MMLAAYVLTLQVYGCSVAAAFDIVHAKGYQLLQYDWPDATFIQSK